MKFKYKLLCLIVFLLSGTSLFAQQNIITGKVTSPEGMPMAGVNVIVDGTTTGTLTDFDGNYSIDRLEQKGYELSLMLKYSLI